MRAREFVIETTSAGVTSAGGIAPVVMPMGTLIKRGDNVTFGKYVNTKRKRRNYQNAKG